MKRILIIMLAAMVALMLASAAEAPIVVENDGDDCQCGTAVIKLNEWGDTIEKGESVVGTYTDGPITIIITEGDGHNLTWSSNIPVCEVVTKPGTALNRYPGGMGGTINDPDSRFISHLSFCYTPGNEIPEFSTIALPIAAILGLAFFFQRRKE
ncbi:PEF-CTERM sorting domain-containing protein [Methanolobus sp. ZRKC5]|uniref:PEF-CTERM sorting domain-containing protein n=1 Tax=unclassified Methanolobus TaxID=2629569 RepID=UPI00313B7D6C